MDAIKFLYYELSTADEHTDDSVSNNWRKDLEHKVNSRKPFMFSYWSQLLANLVSCCCCCLKQKLLNRDSWFSRQSD